MNERKLGSTSYPYQFFMASSADHTTGVTGLTPTALLSKNGGAFAAPAGAIAEVGLGWYAFPGNATDRNVLGDCLLHVTAPGCDAYDGRFVVVPWDPFDPNLALVALPAAAAGTTGGLPTVDANNAIKLPVGTGAGQINLAGGSVPIAQPFPANFAGLAIDGTGKVGANNLPALPANFAGLAINAGGGVTVGGFAGGVTAPLPVGTGAGQINLAGGSVSIAQPFPANFAGLVIDGAGKVGANNLPAPPTFPANFAGLAINAAGAVTAGTVADKSGYSLAPNGLDAVSIEAGVNARQAVSAILASAVGVLAGAATNTITIQGGNAATTRVTATVDADGNRTAVTLNLP